MLLQTILFFHKSSRSVLSDDSTRKQVKYSVQRANAIISSQIWVFSGAISLFLKKRGYSSGFFYLNLSMALSFRAEDPRGIFDVLPQMLTTWHAAHLKIIGNRLDIHRNGIDMPKWVSRTRHENRLFCKFCAKLKPKNDGCSIFWMALL